MLYLCKLDLFNLDGISKKIKKKFATDYAPEPKHKEIEYWVYNSARPAQLVIRILKIPQNSTRNSTRKFRAPQQLIVYAFTEKYTVLINPAPCKTHLKKKKKRYIDRPSFLETSLSRTRHEREEELCNCNRKDAEASRFRGQMRCCLGLRSSSTSIPEEAFLSKFSLSAIYVSYSHIRLYVCVWKTLRERERDRTSSIFGWKNVTVLRYNEMATFDINFLLFWCLEIIVGVMTLTVCEHEESAV